MSNELPNGWTTTTLREVIEDFQPGFASGEKNVEGGVAHLRMNNIGLDGKLVLDLIRTVPGELAKPRHNLSRGDVLVCTTNSGALVGKCAYFDLEGSYAFSNHITRVRPRRDVIDGRFLRWNLWLHWKRGVYDDKCKHWVNQSTLPKDALLEDEVVLPPLAEQRRVVAKLEKLLVWVDVCKQRLEKLPILLKRFRQSVLAAACSGRLTADWREANPASNITEDDELPPSWQRATVEKLIPKGGIFDGPFGSNLKSDDYTDSGVRVIRLENIGQLRFNAEKETFISREKYETLTRHTVGEGDIIFASFIMDEVRACVLPKLSTKAIAKADCFCLRPNPDLIDRQYLVFQLISQESFNALVESIHGATRPRINTTQLKKLEVKICPLAEQQEIVRRVQSLFALADQLEMRLAQARKQVHQLTPSLLVRAFTGKLVPQDANDEPASVLLERISKQREEENDENIFRVDFTKPPSQPQFDMGLPPLPEGDIIELRAALDTYVLTRLPFDKHLGRTKMEKISHFVEYDCGIDLHRDAKRNVAGPVDFLSRLKVEEKAKKLKWFTTVEHEAPERKTRIEYIREKHFEEAIPVAEKFMGNRKPAVDRIIKLLKQCTTDQCSILATLYAAWNDLLLLRKPVSDEAIIKESTVNWHPEKQKISLRDWNWGLDWLRRNNIIPQGRGKLTLRKK